MNDDYHLVPEFPAPRTYVSLRDVAEIPPQPLAAAEHGVPNMIFGVRVVFEGVIGDEIVGMGRLASDGGTVFQIVNITVYPDHQSRGPGTRVTDALMGRLDCEAPPSAFVDLLADVDGYRERWGFEPTVSTSKGMFPQMDESSVRGRGEN